MSHFLLVLDGEQHKSRQKTKVRSRDKDCCGRTPPQSLDESYQAIDDERSHEGILRVKLKNDLSER